MKYGIIADEALWQRVQQERELLRQGCSDAIPEIIYRCCQIKARIVSEDETEQGLRAILNFGHTVGHALEAACGYRRLLHGEAVSIGMVTEALLGEWVGVTPAGTAAEIASTLHALGLPISLPAGIDSAALLSLMQRDKKARQAQVHFVFIARIGQACLPMAVDEADVLRVIDLHRERFG
jgi:3-dehydroquinate synthase